MIYKKKTRIRLFSIIASILMFFSLTTPAFAGVNQQGSDLHRSLFGTNTLEKVSERLLDEFKEDEKVTFLVKFKESVDVTKVAEEARNKASLSNLSGHDSKILQRSAIVSELKATSFRSHENVISYLESEQEKGAVEEFHSYFIVNGMAVTATKEIAEKIASFAEVEKVLPNEKRQLHETFKSTEEAPQSNLENVEWNVERVGAPEVWDMGIDGTGTVVASLDTGVQWDHPALKEKYRGFNSATGEVDHKYSFLDATRLGRTTPYDDHGHGTHVTGTMVGSEPNGANQIGVAPGAEWIAVKVFDGAGETSDAILIAGAEWILAPGGRVDLAPDVVNNSWGGGPGKDEWYRDLVKTWREYGIFPEFSAGNTTLFNPGGPGSIAVPANYPESFATGATDVNDQLAGFSLRGPSPYGEIKPEITAPGVNIRSAVPGSGYDGGWNGTSFAGPAVSAVVALLRQVNAEISVDLIEEVLLDTATPLTDDEYPESPNNGYGWGLVDAYEAVFSIIDGLGTIEGQVTKDGDDNEPPTYEHTPVTEASAGRDLQLQVDVSDNISISSVKLSYKNNDKDWETITASQKSGDYQSGTFEVVIPGEKIDGGTLHYKWILNDFGNNEVVTDEYEVFVRSGVSIGYVEDFEEDPVGWTSFGENDSWEWGVPRVGPRSAYSGDKVYATNLSGDYDDNTDATLLMPKVSLPEGEAYLQFMHWHKLEEYHGQIGRDFGYVVVSTDKENWRRLLTVQGESRNWRSVEVDLSDFAGQDIYVGFNLQSNYNITEEGWYIDDVRLTDKSMDSQKAEAELQREDVAENNVTLEKELHALPLDAQVTILENGRTINTNPADGTFSLLHATGTYTVEASAYGYHSEQQTITVENNEAAIANFNLEEKSIGTLNGTITDKVTGETIDGAKVILLEDANVEPAQTAENGQFSMKAYEGTYTLKVVARDFHDAEFEVTFEKGTVDVNLELDPYYTYPDGIGYDDGTMENARVFLGPGNGWAVKMSLPEHEEKALVTDGAFFFGDIENGNQFEVEVWDATGEDGLPGERIAGPVAAEATSVGEWTVVDLTDEQIFVEDDFYMVYIQPDQGRFSPFLGVDLNSHNAERSYQYAAGNWSRTPDVEGNYMIRTRVSYEIDTPNILSPGDGSMTNEAQVVIKGTASPTTEIQILNNDEEVATNTVDNEGNFESPIELVEGTNTLQAVTLVDGKPTLSSDLVSVTLDTKAPEITIHNPRDNETIDRETVIVEGTVTDDHLDYVEVNGEKADLDGDHFSKRIIVDEGESTITVTAYDKAGNVSEKLVNVYVEYDFGKPIVLPEIFSVKPETDLTVYPGDEVSISFTSDVEEGQAAYFVHLPSQSKTHSLTESNMTEIEPGLYEGTWTVPQNINFDGLTIKVSITDEDGLTTTKEANGKLFISTERTDRISGTTRFDTAVEVSKAGWDEADTVILARSDEYADALAGVPLAHKLDAPILLTRSGSLVDATRAEIERLGAEKVIILGGIVAISDEVANELEGAGIEVERVSGKSRYETAVAIAEKLSPEGADKAVIASGNDFPDALSVASQAAIHGLPILLTRANSLPESTEIALTSLGVTETVVVGGTIAISDSVMKQLPGAERVRGQEPYSDRYGTNIAIQEHFNVQSDHLYVATGTEFADALTGAVLAAKNNSSVLLVKDVVPEVVAQYIEKDIQQLTLFGGTKAISEDVSNELEKLLK